MNWLFWQDTTCNHALLYACAKFPGKFSLSRDDQFLSHHKMKQDCTVPPERRAPFIMTTSFITKVHISGILNEVKYSYLI